MALTEEQKKSAVEPRVTLFGLMLADHKKFGDDSLKVAHDYFYNLGLSAGQSIKQNMGITGNDAHAMAAVVNAVLAPLYEKEDLFTVESSYKLTANCAHFCPIMEAVKTIHAPWETMCSNYAWPVLEGLMYAVNPKAKFEIPEYRGRGDKRCHQIITIPH